MTLVKATASAQAAASPGEVLSTAPKTALSGGAASPRMGSCAAASHMTARRAPRPLSPRRDRGQTESGELVVGIHGPTLTGTKEGGAVGVGLATGRTRVRTARMT